MMTVIHRKNGGYRIYAKGASEIILSRFNSFFKFNECKRMCLLGVNMFSILAKKFLNLMKQITQKW